MISNGLNAENGGRPDNRWNSVAPIEYTSLGGDTALPEHCSGDMYSGVPMMAPARVTFSDSVSTTCRARPKSASFTRKGVSGEGSGVRVRRSGAKGVSGEGSGVRVRRSGDGSHSALSAPLLLDVFSDTLPPDP